MGIKSTNATYVKDGFYLEPISPTQIDRDSYELALKILLDRLENYRQDPPLLIPVMRGGARPFLSMSGSFRYLLRNGERNVDYKGLKVGRYTKGAVGKTEEINVDENDAEKIRQMLQSHSEGILIDDVFDHGVSTAEAQKSLLAAGKPVIIATLYRKPEMRRVAIDANYWVRDYSTRNIDGVNYPPWLVFPWEIDDHDPETWEKLFPEFAGLHPASFLTKI